MNKDRFHNQLALRLGYDRIANNKGLAIKVEYDNPNDPRIVIELPEGVTERFYASEEPAVVKDKVNRPEAPILEIVEAAHEAYLDSMNDIYYSK